MMVFLQETKCTETDEKVKELIWDQWDRSWLFSPVEGLSGGLAISWNNKFFSLKSYEISKSWIWIRGTLANATCTTN